MALTNRGITYCELGQLDKGLADFNKAIDLDSKLVYAWHNRGVCFKSQRQYGEASRRSYQGRRPGPEVSPAWRKLGEVHYRVGNWKEAVAALKESTELRNGGDSFDWFFLAMAYWQLGDKGEARRWYQKAAAWMKEKQPGGGELNRLRTEASGLLEVEVIGEVEIAPPPREKK